MLEEKILGFEADIALLDERITELKAQDHHSEAAKGAMESSHSMSDGLSSGKEKP
jgi:hypothetical protein